MTGRPAIDLAAVRRVLLVKLSSLGDVVHATPVFRAVREALPDAHVTLAVDRAYAALVEGHPALDAVVRATPGTSRIGRWREAPAALAGLRFDLAIDLQGSLRSARWINASRARWKAGRAAPGTRRAWRLGWRPVVRPDPRQHAIRVCAAVAEAVGIAVGSLEPEIHPSPEADAAVAALLARRGLPAGGFLLVNPFTLWPSKTWPAADYAELIRRLAPAIDAPIIITGGPAEAAGGEALAAVVGHPAVLSLTGRLTLDQALCLYARAALMVTGDSGPMHAAAALGTKVVALFGPTWPQCTGPWGAGHRVVSGRPPPSPQSFRDDPAGAHIRSIPVAAVERAVREAWAERPAQGWAASR
jgi:heptosyltransferase I